MYTHTYADIYIYIYISRHIYINKKRRQFCPFAYGKSCEQQRLRERLVIGMMDISNTPLLFLRKLDSQIIAFYQIIEL